MQRRREQRTEDRGAGLTQRNAKGAKGRKKSGIRGRKMRAKRWERKIRNPNIEIRNKFDREKREMESRSRGGKIGAGKIRIKIRIMITIKLVERECAGNQGNEEGNFNRG